MKQNEKQITVLMVKEKPISTSRQHSFIFIR